MIKPIFRSDWRTQNRRKRWFYARYMGWLEKAGYVTVALIVGAFIFAFNYKVDDFIAAEDVPIEAESTMLTSEHDSLVVEHIAPDYAEVKAGQAVLRIAVGPQQIAAWKLYLAGERYMKETGLTVSNGSETMPEAIVIKSPIDGVYVSTTKIESDVTAKEPLAKVLDYTKLIAKGDLKGKTVASAAADQPAQLSNIKFETPDQSLLRASIVRSDGTVAIISRNILGDQVRTILNQGLQGHPVLVREEAPFTIKEVQSVEVDATLQAGPGGTPTMAADPSVRATLKGVVAAGEHIMKVQVSDLPESVRTAATEALRKRLAGQTIGGSGFGDAKVDDAIRSVDGVRFVIQASAVPGGTAGEGLAASAVDRKFAATVRLLDPPAELIRRLRLADREGRKITAKVEVKTGRRPIAYFLLRKS